MHLRISLPLVALILCVTVPRCEAAEGHKSNEQRVRDYVVAYNEKDVDAMLNMVSDDVQWLNVTGDKVSVEAQGKLRLRESLTAYFKSTPSAKSDLEWVQATASRVAAMERASWQGKSGPRSQASLSVYEFRGGLISRVYYYPAEK